MQNKQLSIGDLVVYSTKGICRVTEVVQKIFDREVRDYYVLSPIYDNRSTYFIPVDYDSDKVHIKDALQPDEAKALLQFAKTAKPLDWIANPNERRQQFDRVYKAEPRREKIKLIKALKAHERQQKAHGKQLYAADSRILSGCEALIVDELAHVLNLPQADILPYLEP
ncbi:MAG: CarD family transcriptional regulator [Eubacterium sp.]|nr:CarD family transcriptional regulator [Eubacterium sp.]